MKTTLLIILVAIAASFSITTGPQVPPNPPVTVPYVDIAKYLGAWY
jgi:lipocalin